MHDLPTTFDDDLRSVLLEIVAAGDFRSAARLIAGAEARRISPDTLLAIAERGSDAEFRRVLIETALLKLQDEQIAGDEAITLFRIASRLGAQELIEALRRTAVTLSGHQELVAVLLEAACSDDPEGTLRAGLESASAAPDAIVAAFEDAAVGFDKPALAVIGASAADRLGDASQSAEETARTLIELVRLELLPPERLLSSDLSFADRDVAVAADLLAGKKVPDAERYWLESNPRRALSCSPDAQLQQLARSTSSIYSLSTWSALIAELGERPSIAVEEILTLLYARAVKAGDVDQIAPFILGLAAKAAGSAAAMRVLVIDGPGWRLWRHPEFETTAAKALEGLPPEQATFLKAAFAVLADQRDAAARILEGQGVPAGLSDLAQEIIASATFRPISKRARSRPNTDDEERLRGLPPAKSRVLVVCERGADPGAILNLPDRDYEIVFCSMDSWAGQNADIAKEYWSLRDMFSDIEPDAHQVAYGIRSLCSSIVSYFSIQQTAALESERRAYTAPVFQAALEDAVRANVAMTFCLLRAVEAFRGEHVVLVLKDAQVLENYWNTFSSLNKWVSVVFSSPNARSASRRLQARMNGALKAPSEAPDDQAVVSFFQEIEETDYTRLIASLPEFEGPSVVVMGAFGDPIYLENIIPCIKELLQKYNVYVLEPLSYDLTKRSLQDAFGETLRHVGSKNKLALINFAEDLNRTLRKRKKIDRVVEHLTTEALSRIEGRAFIVKGLDLRAFLERNLSAMWRKNIVRFEYCLSFYEQLFSTRKFEGLFAFSERLPVRMTAVAAAKKLALPSVDVMSVNAVQLPNYRVPQADYLTSMDTLTTKFFKDFYGIPPGRVALTGAPRMDQILEKVRKSDVATTREKLGMRPGDKAILYACQLQPIERCLSILRQLVLSTERDPTAHLIVKLHRRENYARERAYEQAVENSSAFDRIHLVRDEPYLSDIVHSLKVADVVVSIYSNALREAACIGKPVVVADYFGTLLPFDYVADGFGYRASTPEQLTELVSSIISEGVDPFYLERQKAYLDSNPQLTDGTAAARIASTLERDNP